MTFLLLLGKQVKVNMGGWKESVEFCARLHGIGFTEWLPADRAEGLSQCSVWFNASQWISAKKVSVPRVHHLH